MFNSRYGVSKSVEVNTWDDILDYLVYYDYIKLSTELENIIYEDIDNVSLSISSGMSLLSFIVNINKMGDYTYGLYTIDDNGNVENSKNAIDYAVQAIKYIIKLKQPTLGISNNKIIGTTWKIEDLSGQESVDDKIVFVRYYDNYIVDITHNIISFN